MLNQTTATSEKQSLSGTKPKANKQCREVFGFEIFSGKT